MEYYSDTENEIMPFAAAWLDLEIIIVSEVSHRKTTTIWYHIYGINLQKMMQINLYAKQKETHRSGKLMVAEGEGVGRNKFGVWD